MARTRERLTETPCTGFLRVGANPDQISNPGRARHVAVHAWPFQRKARRRAYRCQSASRRGKDLGLKTELRLSPDRLCRDIRELQAGDAAGPGPQNLVLILDAPVRRSGLATTRRPGYQGEADERGVSVAL
jgi:hypothetical protein